MAHKRTFLFLEQAILKHGADELCVNVKDIHEGVDFYFASRAHAIKFVDFLQALVPIRYRHDKQLGGGVEWSVEWGEMGWSVG